MKIRTTKLDRIFSLYIRERDGWRCRRCKTPYRPPTSSLQCAHIFGRRSRGTRWLPANAIALCAGCHIHFTGQPLQFYDWLKSEIGESALDKLRFQSTRPTKFTHSDEDMMYAELKRLHKEATENNLSKFMRTP